MDLEQMRQNTAGMILRFSIPAIISMILTSLITIADGFFIGNYVGKEGITGTFLWREAAGIRPASGSESGDLPR